MSQTNPSEPPPAYEKVVGTNAPAAASGAGPSTLATSASSGAGGAGAAASTSAAAGGGNHQSAGVNEQGQRVPRRRDSSTEEVDIEDETRPLPPGWVPQYSDQHDRFFFVDTLDPNGPRSIWTHPLDDPEWKKKVPNGMDPIAYVHKLWQEVPMPTPDGPPGRQQQQLFPAQGAGSAGAIPAGAGAGYRQGGTQGMQPQYPGTMRIQTGQNGVQRVTMEDLTQYYLSKMGSPEEYERKNPPSKVSKMFHQKETARQRQRRHAEHKARDMADALSYRQPAYGPYGYGYPGYNRGYGMMYPGLGLSAGLLGLGTGAVLGSAFF